MPISSEYGRDKWKGKQLWEKIELFSIFGIYAIILFSFQLIKTMGTTVFVFIIMGVIFYGVLLFGIKERLYRLMSDKNAGRRVITGWIDEEEDLGEEFEFPVKSIHPFKSLPEMEKEAIAKFETWMNKKVVELIEQDKHEEIENNLKNMGKKRGGK